VLAGTQRESRPDSESDKDLFTVLKECNSTIPVVVISTKVDTLKDTYRGQEVGKLSFEELADKKVSGILEAKLASRVGTFKKKIEAAFKKTSQGYRNMAGPIFTSTGEYRSAFLHSKQRTDVQQRIRNPSRILLASRTTILTMTK
jgi:hypothetical protein